MVDEPSSLGEAVMLGAGSIEHRELIYYTVSKSTTFEPPRYAVVPGPRRAPRRDIFVYSQTRQVEFLKLYTQSQNFHRMEGRKGRNGPKPSRRARIDGYKSLPDNAPAYGFTLHPSRSMGIVRVDIVYLRVVSARDGV